MLSLSKYTTRRDFLSHFPGHKKCLFLLSLLSGVYISEIAHPRYRGSFVAMQSLSLSLGMLISYFLFYLLKYRPVCWIVISVPVVTFVLMYFLPETPYWLVEKGRHEEARCEDRSGATICQISRFRCTEPSAMSGSPCSSSAGRSTTSPRSWRS